MKVIGIKNPFAWMIVNGHKKVEYRNWKTTHQGTIGIHASVTPAFPWDEDDEFERVLLPAMSEMDFGAIIGTVEIVECVQGEDSRWNWILRNPKRFDKPIYCGGKRGIWDYNPDANSLNARPAAGEDPSPDRPSTVDGSTANAAPIGAAVIPATPPAPPLQRATRLSEAATTSTPYHSKYHAWELTRRRSADNAEKLSQSLLNATVDLNPHQVEAALFAFRSPLSRGAILADEVGLGKTIEAGLIISQLWAERKRRVLCILPAALRKQWNRELTQKFFIDSTLLEAKNYNALKKKAKASPFLQENRVVICSYQFARSKAAELQGIPWDLVVIDEAHRLRNVYKKSNKIARGIRDAIGARPKILLTATPLQNSLMELYGLVTFVDEHTFGSEESFREQFVRRGDNADVVLFQKLRSRIQHLCQRTLRRQVTEYVQYTKRISITQDFTPTNEELRLYDAVTAYMQKDELMALPSGQRQLITLILRKILASSSFAISATLTTLIRRLEIMQRKATLASDDNLLEEIGADVEAAAEVEDEWDEDDAGEDDDAPDDGLTDEERARRKIEAIRNEVIELKNYKALAESITANAKGQALLLALKAGFAKAAELGSPRKALIFTESRRTQTYLRGLLEENSYTGKIVIFNGTNTDPESKAIYQAWLVRHKGQECITGSPTADMRSALVEEFADRASVMIATESAAEGVNLQFCNLVVNYDLPWNPQRIEQRIGRCHRYNQAFDVVVINFLNRSNEADQRVFELLSEKFKLFDGVFGASDEVMGTLESGVDFEKRINEIYQKCRTSDEIKHAFDRLQQELEEKIQTGMTDARTKLLENFDEEVHQKLRLRSQETENQLGRFGDRLWRLTRQELANCAAFDVEGSFGFQLSRLPEGIDAAGIPLGKYRLITDDGGGDEIHYRIGHPLAEQLLSRARGRDLPVREVVLEYTQFAGKIGLIEGLVGRSGWMSVSLLSITALETQDHLVGCGVCDDGTALDSEMCDKLLMLPGAMAAELSLPEDARAALDRGFESERGRALNDATQRNQRFFETEMLKLDLWADDLKVNLEHDLKELERSIKETRKEARQAPDLAAKIALQRKVSDLERARNDKRRNLFDAQDKIEADKDTLIGQVEAQLKQKIEVKELFTLRWKVV